MDTDKSENKDLNDLASRLSDWRPDVAGLDVSAMAFAAGLAAGRSGRGRLLLPALCGLLTTLAAALGVWGLTERAERQALASRLRERDAAATTAVAVGSEPAYVPSPMDYFQLRRQLERDPIRGPVAMTGPTTHGPLPPEPAIYRVGQLNQLLDQ